MCFSSACWLGVPAWFAPRSYDEENEDAQNPFPAPEPASAKQKLERKGAKRLDTQTTAELETPPPKKSSRKETSDGENSNPVQKVQAALRRPHTVDMENTGTRKQKAKTIQRNLSAEFREAKNAAAASPKTASDKGKDANEQHSNKRKKIELSGPAKPSKLPKHIEKADKEKAAQIAKEDAYAVKDHQTARGSTDEAPHMEEGTSPEAGRNDDTKKKKNPDPEKSAAKADKGSKAAEAAKGSKAAKAAEGSKAAKAAEGSKAAKAAEGSKAAKAPPTNRVSQKTTPQKDASKDAASSSPTTTAISTPSPNAKKTQDSPDPASAGKETTTTSDNNQASKQEKKRRLTSST